MQAGDGKTRRVDIARPSHLVRDDAGGARKQGHRESALSYHLRHHCKGRDALAATREESCAYES